MDYARMVKAWFQVQAVKAKICWVNFKIFLYS